MLIFCQTAKSDLFILIAHGSLLNHWEPWGESLDGFTGKQRYGDMCLAEAFSCQYLLGYLSFVLAVHTGIHVWHTACRLYAAVQIRPLGLKVLQKTRLLDDTKQDGKNLSSKRYDNDGVKMWCRRLRTAYKRTSPDTP